MTSAACEKFKGLRAVSTHFFLEFSSDRLRPPSKMLLHGDLSRMLLAFSVAFIIYANPALSQLGECTACDDDKRREFIRSLRLTHGACECQKSDGLTHSSIQSRLALTLTCVLRLRLRQRLEKGPREPKKIILCNAKQCRAVLPRKTVFGTASSGK